MIAPIPRKTRGRTQRTEQGEATEKLPQSAGLQRQRHGHQPDQHSAAEDHRAHAQPIHQCSKHRRGQRASEHHCRHSERKARARPPELFRHRQQQQAERHHGQHGGAKERANDDRGGDLEFARGEIGFFRHARSSHRRSFDTSDTRKSSLYESG
jgi:hypothetical protein